MCVQANVIVFVRLCVRPLTDARGCLCLRVRVGGPSLNVFYMSAWLNITK